MAVIVAAIVPLTRMTDSEKLWLVYRGNHFQTKDLNFLRDLEKIEEMTFG